MSVHDAVLLQRERLVGLIDRSPNRRAACREVGIHHSTYYRWRRQLAAVPVVDPLAGRSWRSRHVEQRIVAAALAYPALGPLRVADELAGQGLMVSGSMVWRTLVRHRLNTRRLRYQLLRAHQTDTFIAPLRPVSGWVGELDATVPGDLVQMDCFHVGSFKETRIGTNKAQRGVIWQYTAIDVASSWTWAELHTTSHNPSPAITSALAHRVAQDLTQWGWEPKTFSTDNGNEFRAQLFGDTLEGLGIEHRFIRAGRPQSNGKVERVQGTILEECYQPSLIGYVQPSITGLRQDLANYLTHYNYRRPHRGKWNQGKPPIQIIQPDAKLTP